jgi:hypothetical protein
LGGSSSASVLTRLEGPTQLPARFRTSATGTLALLIAPLST